MQTKEENAVQAKKSSYTEEDLEKAYNKGLRIGRAEGMLIYQKRIIDNLQRDNTALNQKLEDAKK